MKTLSEFGMPLPFIAFLTGLRKEVKGLQKQYFNYTIISSVRENSDYPEWTVREDLTRTNVLTVHARLMEDKIPADDGAFMQYSLVVPETPASSGHLVVFVHGFGCTRERWIEESLWCAKSGYASVAFDMRGSASSNAECSFGMKEKSDVLQMIEHIRERHGLGGDGVCLIGESVGASIILQAIMSNERGLPIMGALCIGLYPSADSLLRKCFTHTIVDRVLAPLSEQIHFSRLNPLEIISDISVPVTFVWGSKDEYVTEDEKKSLLREYLAKDPSVHPRIYEIENAGHCLGRQFQPQGKVMYAKFLAVLEEFLQGSFSRLPSAEEGAEEKQQQE